MFARFDENPTMTLRVIKETKRYGRTDGRTDGRTHGWTDARTDARTDNVKTVYPLQTKFAGGIISYRVFMPLAKALIRLRVCAACLEPLLAAHTTLFEISCHGSISYLSNKLLKNLFEL